MAHLLQQGYFWVSFGRHMSRVQTSENAKASLEEIRKGSEEEKAV